MKAFVTGGTGFLGRSLVRRLVEAGHEVHALARSDSGLAEMKALGASPVRGDINDPTSMRGSMQGCDWVFHLAGWYMLGARDRQNAEKVNVEGTQNVLSLAYELGVPKILYTSTLAVFGDTHGQLVDEGYRMPAGQEFLTEYDRTKWKAHYEVALPLIEKGAPVIILMPGVVYGPGDHSLNGEFMRRFYFGLFPFPIFLAPDITLTFAHVDDMASGHLLAAEKGEPGETYILAGPAVPMSEMVRLWARVNGRPEPGISVPARFLKPFAPVMDLISSYLPLPELFSGDALRILDASYTARADKARAQLGWQTRPLEDGMRETFEWFNRTGAPEERVLIRGRQVYSLALGVGTALLLLWLSRRKRS